MLLTASNCDLSIVIPCAGDAGGLTRLLPRVQQTLDRAGICAEILVVGSTDAVMDAATRGGATAVRQAGDGYGSAVRAGLERATADYVVTMDADSAHPLALLPYLYQARHEADVVIASRYVRHGFAAMPLVRRVLSRWLNRAFRRMLDLPFHDLSSGYRLYNRRAIASLKIVNSTHAFLQETLIKAYCQGYAVKEIPMHYRADSSGERRLSQLGVDYLRTARAMWRLRNSTESSDYDTRAFYSRIPLQRYWQRKRYAIITGFVGHAGRVLDAGCGSTQMLNGMPQTIGMDPLMRKLRFMRLRGRRLVNGSTFALPFQDGAFDVVISSQVIEHLPEDDVIFSELVRCVRPGGTLVLGTVDYGGWQWPLIEWAYSVAKPTGYADEHITHYTRTTLFERLRRMGLSVEDHQYILGGEIIIKATKPADARG
jgi:SAM-dependent methyltransferase